LTFSPHPNKSLLDNLSQFDVSIHIAKQEKANLHV
jgi:hypothetical protein